MTELAGNITSPMWIGDRHLVSRPTPKASAICIRAGPTAPTCAGTPTTTISTRATRRPTAGASSINAARRSGCSIPRSDATTRARRSTCRRIARRRRASSSTPAENLARLRCASGGPQRSRSRRAASCSRSRCGKARCASTASPDGVRYRHGQWLADGDTRGRGQRRDGRGARRRHAQRRDAIAAVGHRPRRRDARSAAGQRDRARQPSQRSAARSTSTPTRATVDRPQRLRPHRERRLVARRRLARLPVLDQLRGIRRSSCTTSRAAQSTLVTTPEFRDYSPAFDPDGKYLYFLSLAHVRSGLRQRPVRAELPARGAAVPDRAAGGPAAAVRAGTEGHEARGPEARRATAPSDKPHALRVDLDGIARRVAAFPVPEGRFEQIAGVAGDKVVWTLMPIAGAHGRGGHKDAPGRARGLRLQDAAAPRRWSTSSTTSSLAGRSRDARAARQASACAPSAPTASPTRASARSQTATSRRARAAGSISGACASRSIRAREWRQMLREVWRLQRDQFWVPDMSGIDWEAVYARYEPLLDRVATRSELSDLIWEMQGELGTSHAYETGGDHRKPPPMTLGHLAAELRLGDRRRRATRSPRIVARRPVGRRRRFAAERDRRPGAGRASASSPSTASRCRASARRRRCSSTRRTPRWS